MPTPPDDILLNKAAIIERCIRRIAEDSRACPRYDAAHLTNTRPAAARRVFCFAPLRSQACSATMLAEELIEVVV